MEPKSKTMVEWLLGGNVASEILTRVGISSIIIAAVARDFFSHLRPSPLLNMGVSLLMALLLALPVVCALSWPSDRTIRRLGMILAFSSGFTGALYFLKLLANFPQTGFDAVTDLVSTLFDVAAWYILSERERDRQGFIAERSALAVVALAAVLFAVLKLVFDLRPATLEGADPVAQSQAARLIFNLCSGAVFLSLYALMRRLLQQPDPVNHVIILLYGCAQIAAHGRDCLTAAAPCPPGSVEAAAAYSIEWILFLGKISFGLYVLYLYSHGRFTGHDPVVEAQTDGRVEVR